MHLYILINLHCPHEEILDPWFSKEAYMYLWVLIRMAILQRIKSEMILKAPYSSKIDIFY